MDNGVITKDGDVVVYMYGEQAAKMIQAGGGVDDTVHIPRGEYEDLLNDSRWLACLEQVGVNNWEGFDEALQLFDETADNFPEVNED